jgi:hypothetical protein
MNKKKCSYCGREVNKTQHEHIFPRNLYPQTKAQSKIQRLTIPACSKCNNSWADDEAHFRNVLILAGDNPNLVRDELFSGPISRSFKKLDGMKRISDLLDLMKPIETEHGKRQMIYPAEDDRILRVVKKVIRGLCHYHQLYSPILGHRVWVDVLKYSIPAEYINSMNYFHRERDIAEYWYSEIDDDLIQSVWIIRFFETVKFIGLVSKSKDGFPNYATGKY